MVLCQLPTTCTQGLSLLQTGQGRYLRFPRLCIGIRCAIDVLPNVVENEFLICHEIGLEVPKRLSAWPEFGSDQGPFKLPFARVSNASESNAQTTSSTDNVSTPIFHINRLNYRAEAAVSKQRHLPNAQTRIRLLVAHLKSIILRP